MTTQEGDEVGAALLEHSRTASVAVGMSAANAAAIVQRLRDRRAQAERAVRLAAARGGVDEALAAAARDIADGTHAAALAAASFPTPLHPSLAGARRGSSREPAGRSRASTLTAPVDQARTGRSWP
ncbi:MAG: hypothetical protein ACFCVG_00815 [Kineosporiaceae bacterium]